MLPKMILNEEFKFNFALSNCDDRELQEIIRFRLLKILDPHISSVPHSCHGDRRGPSMLSSDIW